MEEEKPLGGGVTKYWRPILCFDENLRLWGWVVSKGGMYIWKCSLSPEFPVPASSISLGVKIKKNLIGPIIHLAL